MKEFKIGISTNEDFFNFIISEKINGNTTLGIWENQKTLASGRKSNWYVNWRNSTNDIFYLTHMLNYIIPKIIQESKSIGLPEAFYGVPDGATKLGLFLQYLLPQENIFLKPETTVSRSKLEKKAIEIINGTGNRNPTNYIGYPGGTVASQLGLITQYEYAKTKWEKNNFEPNKYYLPMFRTKPKGHGDSVDQHFVGIPTGDIAIIVDETWDNDLRKLEEMLPKETNIQQIIYFGEGKAPKGWNQLSPKIYELGKNNDLETKKYNPSTIGLIEDVWTTGKSALAQVQFLQNLGIRVTQSWALTNRNEKTPIFGIDEEELCEQFLKIYEAVTEKKYDSKGIPVEVAYQNAGIFAYAFSLAAELLPEAVKFNNTTLKIRKAIQDEFETYGTKKIFMQK